MSNKTTPRRRLARLAVIAAPLLLAGAAYAQYGGQYQGPPGGPPSPNGAPSRPPMSQADTLRQTLRLRPEQEGGLQAFLAAVQPPQGMMERMRAEDEQARMLPTPQRLDRMLQRMDQMRGFVVGRIAATKRFYAQLSPDQQRAFDQLGDQAGR